jgi:hypothetical protein
VRFYRGTDPTDGVWKGFADGDKGQSNKKCKVWLAWGRMTDITSQTAALGGALLIGHHMIEGRRRAHSGVATISIIVTDK